MPRFLPQCPVAYPHAPSPMTRCLPRCPIACPNTAKHAALPTPIRQGTRSYLPQCTVTCPNAGAPAHNRAAAVEGAWPPTPAHRVPPRARTGPNGPHADGERDGPAPGPARSRGGVARRPGPRGRPPPGPHGVATRAEGITADDADDQRDAPGLRGRGSASCPSPPTRTAAPPARAEGTAGPQQ